MTTPIKIITMMAMILTMIVTMIMIIIVRFGHDWDPTCMKMDETLFGIAEKCKNYLAIYLVDITEVPDFNKMYELYDPCTIMFFFR